MPSSPILILAVDDIHDLCTLVKKFLEMNGEMEVDTAYSVSEARVALAKKRYDVIVSDYQMPGEDGIQFLKSLRAAGDRTPFILFTGKGREEVVIEALNNGADSYLQKGGNPVPQFAELGHRILGLVERSRAEKAKRDSEERFKQLADSADEWIWEVDANGLLIYSNQVVERILGYDPEELIGKVHFFDLKPPEDREQIKKEVFAAFKAKLPIRGFINNGLTKGGKIVLMETSGIPVVDESGRLIGYRGTNKDITERKRAEEALRESEEKYRLIADNMADVVTVMDMGLHFTYISPSIKGIRGFTVEEAMEQSMDQVLTPGSMRLVLDTLSELMKMQENGKAEPDQTIYLELEEYRKDGSIIWASNNISFMRDENGKMTSIIVISSDITERKRVEEALQKKIIALSQPFDDPADIQFSDLFDLEDIQRIQDEFADATNVASIITYPDGTPITKPSHFCHLCNEIIRKTEKGLENCYRSDAEIGCHNPSGPIVRPCLSGGLFDAGASITIGGKHIANWLIGQVRNDELDEQQLLQYADVIGADREEFRKALAKVPIMPKAQFEKIAKALFSLANELSLVAYQNVQQARLLTERKVVESTIRESERRYRLLAENINDVIWTMDLATQRFTYISPSVERLRGFTVEEAMRQTMKESVHPDSYAMIISQLPAWVEHFRLSGKANVSRGDIIRQNRKDGTWVTIEIVSTLLQNEKGEITEVLGVSRDVTARMSAEEALREANRKLNLLSSITRHDINNQLMALTGHLALMDEKKIDASSDRHLRKAEAAAERISSIIQFTKSYEDIGVHAPAWQDVRTLVEKCTKEVHLGQIVVANDVPAGTEVFADPLITKVFHNLIHNSIRHGGNIVTIHFSVEERNGARAIICEDDGVGIRADMKEKLFTQGFGKDHGLGLFLSREILAITGISITEEGEPGCGARFVLTAPAGGLRAPTTN